MRADQHIRGSGDDLSNYFYLLENSENWRPRCAFGRLVTGAEASCLGLPPRGRYVLPGPESLGYGRSE